MLYSILLAGGLSSRMGQDKSKLKLGKETLLQRSLHLLESLESNRILLSGDIDGYDCVPDLLPQCGPLGGLYSSLTHIKQRYSLDNSLVLIIPVDMPMLTKDALETLVTGADNTQCCHFQNEIFPCVMRASEFLYTYLREAFQESNELGGKRSMKGLIRYLEADAISSDNLSEDVFLNMNRPEDWEKLKALYVES